MKKMITLLSAATIVFGASQIAFAGGVDVTTNKTKQISGKSREITRTQTTNKSIDVNKTTDE